MDEKLEPCPFCGSGLAHRTAWGTGFSGVEISDPTNQPYVWCGTCGVRTRTCDSQAEATAAWNTRAAISATPLNAMREALDDEREANAILTKEIERLTSLRAALAQVKP